MRHFFLIALCFTSLARADDASWRKEIVDFAAKHLRHSAWGFDHSARNYTLATALAAEEGLVVDDDVLLAAAYLHDMGGFPEFEKPGVDHAVRSAELGGDLLTRAGFPVDKISAVRGVILAHTYYNPVPPVTPEERVFRDADVLDFLGVIGLVRIVSVTEREKFASDLPASLSLVRSLLSRLPSKLTTKAGEKEAERRVASEIAALRALDHESRYQKVPGTF